MPRSTVKNWPDALKAVLEQCPDELVTYQKGVPTFHPETAQQAGDFFVLCNEAGQSVYITGFGNNIDPVGERFERLIVVRTDRLGALRQADSENLFVDVEAGFPLREINVKLTDSGVFFPLSNLSYVGSVGGAIAVGLSAGLDPQFWGPKSRPEGENPPFINMERYLMELELVTPTGEVKRFGVPSNTVASGENFARFFSPSWGQFGLIVSVKLRLLPESARIEYGNLKQKAIVSSDFASKLKKGGDSYFARIKEKLDPAGVLTTEGLNELDVSKP